MDGVTDYEREHVYFCMSSKYQEPTPSIDHSPLPQVPEGMLARQDMAAQFGFGIVVQPPDVTTGASRADVSPQAQKYFAQREEAMAQERRLLHQTFGVDVIDEIEQRTDVSTAASQADARYLECMSGHGFHLSQRADVALLVDHIATLFQQGGDPDELHTREVDLASAHTDCHADFQDDMAQARAVAELEYASEHEIQVEQARTLLRQFWERIDSETAGAA